LLINEGNVSKKLLVVLVIAIALPSLVMLIGNFFELVLLGEMQPAKFWSNLPDYSYGPVLNYYRGFFKTQGEFCVNLLSRLRGNK